MGFNYSQLTAGKYKVSGLNLLTTNSLKTIKGIEYGILSGILYLSPHKSGGAKEAGKLISVCQSASPACMQACLYRSGAALIYRRVNEARKRKTKSFFHDRDRFMGELAGDIAKIKRLADKRSLLPAVRLNGTSDLAWERIPFDYEGKRYRSIMQAFPAVEFYDYTKREDRLDRRKLPRNYRLIFSRSESNDQAWGSTLRSFSIKSFPIVIGASP